MQDFFFGEDLLLRRHDYNVNVAGGFEVDAKHHFPIMLAPIGYTVSLRNMVGRKVDNTSASACHG